MKTKQQKGFTLVELLVVIAIIGLLSTLAVVALGSARAKARDARRISDIKQIQTALELYNADQGVYPDGTGGITLGTGTALVLCDAGFVADESSCGTVYMGQVPTNFDQPSAIDDYVYTTAAASATTYTITFELEGDTAGLTGGDGNSIEATPSGLRNS